MGMLVVVFVVRMFGRNGGEDLPWTDSIDAVKEVKKCYMRRRRKEWVDETYVTFEEPSFTASCEVRWFTNEKSMQISSDLNRHLQCGDKNMNLTCRFACLV
jgi:predicted lipase